MSTSTLATWRIVGLVAFTLAAGLAFIVATAASDADAARVAIRFTARVSVVLFLLAFTAAATSQLWPGAFTRWQRHNRRYLGLSFALSHVTHLGAILTLRAIAPAELDVATIRWILGGLAYVFIFAMAATSFDRTARALGPKAWSLLHTTGAYYIWLVFANSYVTRALALPEYIVPAIAVVGALGLRIAARLHRRSSRSGLVGARAAERVQLSVDDPIRASGCVEMKR